MEFGSFEEIIELAIEKEREAYTVYAQAAKKATDSAIQKLFEFLANEELRHQEILRGLDVTTVSSIKAVQPSQDGRTVDFLVDKPIDSVDSIQDVFIFSMKRERKAQQFYANTAKSFSGTEAKNILLLLAEEEQKHLDRLEAIYDEKIMGEF